MSPQLQLKKKTEIDVQSCSFVQNACTSNLQHVIYTHPCRLRAVNGVGESPNGKIKDNQSGRKVRGKEGSTWAEFYRSLIGQKENPPTQNGVRSPHL